MEIKEIIKEARTKAGLTQEQAAEQLFVTRQTISNWENGRSLPDIISVLKMSDLYQISLDELLKGDKKMVEKIERDERLRKKDRRLLMNSLTLILVGCISNVLTSFSIGTKGYSEYDILLSSLSDILIIIAGVCALMSLFFEKVFENNHDKHSYWMMFGVTGAMFLIGVLHIGTIFNEGHNYNTIMLIGGVKL